MSACLYSITRIHSAVLHCIGVGYSDGTLATAFFGIINYLSKDAHSNLYVSDHIYDDAGADLSTNRPVSLNNANVTTLAGGCKYIYSLISADEVPVM